MRGMLPGIVPVVPIASRMPGVYADDEAMQAITRALDEVLAPTYTTLDSLWTYLDPHLAPEDFLEWLADWVGVEVDDAWSLERKREIVAQAAQIHRLRGTAAGLELAVRLVTGAEVTVADSGGTIWSRTPGADLPGKAPAELTVTVHVPDPDTVDLARVDRVVRDVKPAHVPHVVEIVEVA
ncbi:phage tail protein I [Occultella glacieicola]|uniref:Phage tail protein I n=1 Tax=Occultella glacieicola TaxID=2518684 RepID=A0ABY2E938_9MICO|nr:phage tail protein I [Occultella glacieicola]TDE98783.1 phage tail protein I [Occultella glacieicola]